ncbi:unnamed protein product [Pylaiella littoralis]
MREEDSNQVGGVVVNEEGRPPAERVATSAPHGDTQPIQSSNERDCREASNDEGRGDGGGRSMVLRDGRAMAPAFSQTGEVLCHDVSTTSVRVTWPKFSDKKYPVYSYRVCTAEVGSGFEVTYGEAPSHKTEAVVVGLMPGKAYQFHVACVTTERMLVPGSSIVSRPVRLPEAGYERAWFFEGGGEDIKWTAFEGLGPDTAGPTGADVGGGGSGGVGDSSTALDDIRCSPSSTRCYTGLRSLRLTVPSGLAGGAYVDTPVKEGWLYIVKVKVFREQQQTHEEATQAPSSAGGTGSGGGAAPSGRTGSRLTSMESKRATGRKGSTTTSAAAAVTTRLVLWDLRDMKEMSAPAVKTGEWETLECQIVPFRSEHLRIAVQTGGEEAGGNVYVDAVELFHGGPTPAELAILSVVGFMDAPRPMPSKVLVHVESARAVRAADAMGTSDPYVKVIVGDAEVHRTKVVAMTLSPVWDETFFLSPEARSRGAASAGPADPDSDTGGVRFEIWDHDFHGKGDYLGEVCLSSDELRAAPPHRVEHKVVRHPVRSGDGEAAGHTTTTPPPAAAAAAAAAMSPKQRRARMKRGHGGGGVGAGEPPTSLALAVQASWPEDPESTEGKLVRTLQDEQGLLPTRIEALKQLSLAALREPRNIEDAARAKEALLRARAAEAAVWVLSDLNFLEHASALLIGLVKLGRDVGGTEAGFGLCRRLRLFVLHLAPAVVAVRCLQASIGPPEALLELLAKLYAGQQAALHEDAVAIPGFFYSLVVHVESSAPAQALVREISGGRRDFPPRLLELFRRYRTRIPPLPGLWRASVLQKLSAEEAHPPDMEEDDDFDANRGGGVAGGGGGGGGGGGERSLLEVVRGNLAVALTLVPPLFKAGVGGDRVGGSAAEGGGSCEQPVGAVLLLDGLLLAVALAYAGCFRLNRRHFSTLAGTWLVPILFAAFLVHLGLVAGLLVSIARVTFVEAGSGRDENDGEVTCSSGTYAWGVSFLVVDLFCLVVPPVWWCLRCYDRVTSSTPTLLRDTSRPAGIVVPDEKHALRDTKPVGDGGGVVGENVSAAAATAENNNNPAAGSGA